MSHFGVISFETAHMLTKFSSVTKYLEKFTHYLILNKYVYLCKQYVKFDKVEN